MSEVLDDASSSWKPTWTATQHIVASEGGVIEAGDVSLVVPPDALLTDTTLTLTFSALAQPGGDEPWSPYHETITLGPPRFQVKKPLRLTWDAAEYGEAQKAELVRKLLREATPEHMQAIQPEAVADARTPSERFAHHETQIFRACAAAVQGPDGPTPPITDPDQLAALLQGTVLAGATLTRLPLPEDPRQFALRIRLNNVEPLVAWSVARTLVAQTGRFPILTTAAQMSVDFQGEESFEQAHSGHEDAAGEHGIDTDISDSPYVDHVRAMVDVDLAQELEEARARFEERESTEECRSSSSAHLDWFGPSRWGAVLVLLPTPNSWETIAYQSWWGAQGEGPARAMSFFKRWNERHGAELICNYGTMLQFVVPNPPTDADTALDLAKEQAANGYDTVCLPGLSTREHARALLSLRRWFLRSQP
ncbi:DUF4253 domain-containing protein [Piscinibacter terrae]|uniref:DUF4253 domain-containing protein n=1 Tax=Piscinibacter terrae TaxID=2496871 RepID=A0A3N7HPP3_9BURK|nr:DUF4253 domain-containing protein [Albitalea terrae]RQP23096.1 DUF4253 domain-containing protein [Albitalea terrae]